MDMGLPEHPGQRETSSPSSSRRPLLLLAIARDGARVLSHLFPLHLLLVKLPHHVHLREARARLINPRARHFFALPSEPEKLGFLLVVMSDDERWSLDRDTLREAMSFINEKNIHLICDEIYAATVFRQPDFISIAEIIEEDQEYNRNLVHIIYSLSKDMGFPGFRVGIVYSYNDAVVECGRKMSSFGLVSSQTQYLIASMLSDDQFIAKFLLESAGRLATRHNDFTDGLRQVGIKCLNGNAGLFLWMDLRGLLMESTVEAETALWRVIINDVKLNVSPGSSFHCSEPGWFRVCIANMNEETTKVALERIREFVLRNGNKPNRKEKCWQSDLRLRLSFRKMDDVLRSPCIMSPHSPIPQSPLVRTRT